MMESLDDWTHHLASAISVAVGEFCAQVESERVVCFDIGCFPWHGYIELSVLTAGELEADPVILSSSKIASWRFYNFSDNVASWTQTAVLGKRMSQAYYSAEEDNRAATAEAFMKACAKAAASPEVEDALKKLPRDPSFRVLVAHPDSGREIWPPTA